MNKKFTLQFIALFLLVFNNYSFGQTYFKFSDEGLYGKLIDWSDKDIITADNDWSNIPFLRGFRGDGLTSSLDVDPRTITADGTGTPVVIHANQTNPDTFTGDGFAEFNSPGDSSIAFRASNTASAPFLMLYLNTENIPTDCAPRMTFVFRDIDGSVNNAVQQISVQYRVGETGPFIPCGTNMYWDPLPSWNFVDGYQPDASRGPSLKEHHTFCETMVPFDCWNQPKVQFRIITTNSSGGNEWIALDDISLGLVCLLAVRNNNFSAEDKGETVNVNWVALSEKNFERFEIERSMNGLVFNKIGDTYSKGQGEFTYSFLDQHPIYGESFYRLKFIKNSGYSYSRVVKLNRKQKEFRMSISPTIVSDRINVLLFSTVAYSSVLQIITADGIIIKQQPLTILKGNNNFPVKTNALSKGNYFVRVKEHGKWVTERFIK